LVRAERLVRQGKPIGASYTGEGLTTELTARYIAAGERSGQLAAMLEHAAEHHERELAWLVERASRIVEPLLLIIVALMIGAIVFLMYMPIFDLVSGFG
jgi:general secretion pathway protein F